MSPPARRIHLRQRGRSIGHIELAGDDVGDQASAVFLEKIDLAVGAVDSSLGIRCSLINICNDCGLLSDGRQGNGRGEELVVIET